MINQEPTNLKILMLTIRARVMLIFFEFLITLYVIQNIELRLLGLMHLGKPLLRVNSSFSFKSSLFDLIGENKLELFTTLDDKRLDF